MKLRSALFAVATTMLLASSLSAQITTWPQQVPSSAGEVTIYPPQIDSYTGNQFTAHAAVSVAQTGGKPTFGAVFFTANVATDRGTDTVDVQSITVTNSRFPSAAAGTADAVSQALSQAATQGTITLSQNQLLSQLALTQKEQAAAADLNNTPPQIIFATSPTVLVTIAGEPKLAAAPNSSILTVVNSPFFIALDPSTKTYYLRGGGQWLSTSDILNGPWAPATSVPDAVSSLAAAQSTSAADDSSAPPASAGSTPPQIIVATQPTELIQTSGPAEYGPIDNTNLLYVTNTQSDVFMDIDSQSLYVLLSGRWFTAPSQAGPWTYVAPNQLPAAFAQIPPGLPISNVLASVPGTSAATNAVLDAQVPQTAAIRRDAPGPNVTYDGDPKFEPVSKSASVTYAVNTDQSVVKVEDTYYVCSEGTWFQSAEPVGPWVVSVEVPEVIYTIPPTCPIYPVTFCRIYTSTPDVVYCGYLPGYTGSYVYGGTVVYGTGWPYNPWFGTVFIPRPVTWGFGATFSLGWGCWGFGIGGGWGAAAFGCGWNSGWWGWGNYHWNNWNWNNHWNQNVNINRNVTNNITNNVHKTTNNIYHNNVNRLTPQERQRLDNKRNHLANQADHDRDQARQSANEQRERDQAQENRDDALRRADERQRENDRADRNRDNVFADRDGNVYRHDGGGWQQREGDEWRQPNRENFERNRGELNRQFGARARGEFRGGRGGGGFRGFHGGGGGGRRR